MDRALSYYGSNILITGIIMKYLMLVFIEPKYKKKNKLNKNMNDEPLD